MTVLRGYLILIPNGGRKCQNHKHVFCVDRDRIGFSPGFAAVWEPSLESVLSGFELVS